MRYRIVSCEHVTIVLQTIIVMQILEERQPNFKYNHIENEKAWYFQLHTKNYS